MPLSIEQFRALRPDFDDVPDAEITKMLGGGAPDPKKSKGLMGDTWVDLKRGVEGLPGAAAGLADLPVALATGYRPFSAAADAIGEFTGFQPGKWADEDKARYSDARQRAMQAIDQAWQDGTIADIAKAYGANPRHVLGTIVQSLPSMLAGGFIGRAAVATGAVGKGATATAAGLGEGAITAGQIMDQLDDVDGRRAAMAALFGGATTGAIGAGSASVARRLHMPDVEEAIVSPRGLMNTKDVAGYTMPWYKAVPGSMLKEGIIEEAPQSAQEQMWQNWAEGKDITAGVPRQMVEGALAGMGQAGPFALRSHMRTAGARRDLVDGLRADGYIGDSTTPTDLLRGIADREAADYRRAMDAFDAPGAQPQPGPEVQWELEQLAAERDAQRTMRNYNPVDTDAVDAEIARQMGGPDVAMQQMRFESLVTPAQWDAAMYPPSAYPEHLNLTQVETKPAEETAGALGMRYAAPGQTLDMFAGQQGTDSPSVDTTPPASRGEMENAIQVARAHAQRFAEVAARLGAEKKTKGNQIKVRAAQQQAQQFEALADDLERAYQQFYGQSALVAGTPFTDGTRLAKAGVGVAPARQDVPGQEALVSKNGKAKRPRGIPKDMTTDEPTVAPPDPAESLRRKHDADQAAKAQVPVLSQEAQSVPPLPTEGVENGVSEILRSPEQEVGAGQNRVDAGVRGETEAAEEPAGEAAAQEPVQEVTPPAARPKKRPARKPVQEVKSDASARYDSVMGALTGARRPAAEMTEAEQEPQARAEPERDFAAEVEKFHPAVRSAFAEIYNSVASERRLPLWDGLSPQQQWHLLSSGKDADAQERALNAVTKEVSSAAPVYRLAEHGPNGKGMSVAAFQRILDDFTRRYKGALQLDLRVVADESAFNGNAKGILGAYYAASRRIVFVAANHGNAAEALETIQHELLGHFGLDLLSPDDKRQILDTVKAAAAANPKLAEIYDREVAEAGGNTDIAAGETLANIAESKLGGFRALLDKITSLWNRALIRVGLRPADFKTVGDLRQQVRMAAAALKRGDEQQTVPVDDNALFRTGAMTLNNVTDALADALTNPIRWAKTHGLGWLTLTQMAEAAKNLAPSVGEYLKASRAMQRTTDNWLNRARHIDLKWSKLDTATVEKVNDLMLRSTMAQFDPSGTTKAGSNAEHALVRAWNSLPDAAKAIYKEVRDHYAAVMEERKKVMLGILDDMYDAKIAAAQEGKEKVRLVKRKQAKRNDLLKRYQEMRGPYFPLKRLGGWYAVGMSAELNALYEKLDNGPLSAAEHKRYMELRADPKHYVTRSYTSERAAKRGQEALAKQFAHTRYNMAEAKSGPSASLTAAGMEDVEAYIDERFSEEGENGKALASRMKALLSEVWYKSLPEHNVLKRQIKRENIEGADTDMRRVFAKTAIEDAHHIGRLSHEKELTSALFKVKDEGRKKGPDARMFFNELVNRAKLAMERTDSPIVDKILTTSYLAHLGLNPAFMLTNMTQVPMITLPWLAGRFKAKDINRELPRAYTDAFKIIKKSYGKDWLHAELDWRKVLTDENEIKMLDDQFERNLLDITIEHDLGAVADDVHNAKVSAVMRGLNLPVHTTELANRLVTALVAYRLSVQGDKNHEHGVNLASKALSETQLDYSALNAPRYLQSMLGSRVIARFAGQFRKYQQGMIWLVAKNTYDWLVASNATPEERRTARNTLLGLFTMTGAFAGALGLPGMGSMMWLATLFGGAGDDDDKPFDAQKEFRNWLTDLVGKDAADVLAKGIPMAAGVDVSKNVGMGDLLSPLPFMKQGKTGSEKVGNFLAAAAGAPAGTLADMIDGVQLMDEGQWAKGAARIVPLKGARNLLTAVDQNERGLTKRNGETIKELDAWDVALRAVGFQSSDVTNYYEANAALEKTKQAANDVRARLLSEYASAKLRGEPTADIDERIKDFNARHPEKGVRIDASTKLKSVHQRRKNANSRTGAGVLASKANQPFLADVRFSGD